MDSQRFDWYPLLTATWLTEKADYVVTKLLSVRDDNDKGASAETRKAKYQQITCLIISALYQANCSGSAVSFPRKKSAYRQKNPKPNQVNLSATIAIAIFNELVHLRWIEVVAEGKAGVTLTLIRASGDLQRHFERLGLRWSPQELIPKENLVVLRDVKRDANGMPTRNTKGNTTKLTLETPDTRQVQQWRDNLYRINQKLVKHCISIDLSDENYLDLEKVMGERKEDDDTYRSVQMHKVQLTRIFSRNSFEKGGRFYRGWWQSIPEIYRPHIRIDGLKVQEVDYSGISIRICAALTGITIPADVDPYDLGLAGWSGPTDPRRKLLKKVINSLINDEDGIYHVTDKKQRQLGVSMEELHHLFEKTHPSIYAQLGSGIGLKSQFMESNIAEAVMLKMIDEGAVCLPIHDSFITNLENVARLEALMLDAFETETGAKVSLDRDIIKVKANFGMTTETVLELAEDPAAGVVSADSAIEAAFSNRSVTDKFVDYWEAWQSEQHRQ